MKITQSQLKQMIRDEVNSVLEDLEMLPPSKLEAEPEQLTEEQSRVSKVVSILNQLPDEDREAIFRHYDRYSYSHFLAQIGRYEKAKKPK